MFHWIQGHALAGPLEDWSHSSCLLVCPWVIVMLEDESFPSLKSHIREWSFANATQVLGWFHFYFGHSQSQTNTRTCGRLSWVSIPHRLCRRQWPSQWTIFSQTADFFMEQCFTLWCHQTIILLELEQSAAPSQFASSLNRFPDEQLIIDRTTVSGVLEQRTI